MANVTKSGIARTRMFRAAVGRGVPGALAGGCFADRGRRNTDRAGAGKVGDLASIYSFNETGSLIWKLLETPTTLIAIVAAMAREFDVTREQAESDAVRFVGEMLSVGLVEVRKAVGETERPVGREGLAAAGAK